MSIIFGTDFSLSASRAGESAAALAKSWGEPLHLVHVVDLRVTDKLPPQTLKAFLEERQGALAKVATELAASSGAHVTSELLHGVADLELTELAAERDARLLVVAALGERQAPRWLIGSTAERVARGSQVPVLVVRDPASLIEWAHGTRRLRVLAALEQSASSKPALRWAADLDAPGGMELIVTQVVWPPGEHSRLGLPGPVALDRLDPVVEDKLAAGFRKWAADVPAAANARLVLVPAWGKVDASIAMLASIEGANAVVVGSHRRSDVAKLWHGSVSAGVIHHADTNVFVVPPDVSNARQAPVEYHVVLAPTDFSPQAARAAQYALALLQSGGTLRLVHVTDSTRPPPGGSELESAWREAIPREAAARHVRVVTEIATADEVARGILQAAARCGADAICMGSQGRGRIAGTLLGSAAQAVLRSSPIPVMLVPMALD
jgi:nucleotide-binding universal stress UspA family protein